MNEENVEVVRGMFEAFSCGGQAALAALDFCDPALEMQDYPGFIDSEWHHGLGGAQEWAAKIWRVFGRVRVEPTEFIEAPDGRLVVVYEMAGEGKRSGVHFTETGYAVFTLRCNKVLRAAAFSTKDAALESVGMREREVDKR